MDVPPPDCDLQAFVSVRALMSCQIHLPHNLVFQDCVDRSDDDGSWAPVFSFILTHPTHGHLLFDLGVRKHGEGYSPYAMPRVRVSKASMSCEKDVAALLIEDGIQPADIKTIIFSHLHWDHIGDPARFESANLIFGAGAKRQLATEVYPTNPAGTITDFGANRNLTFLEFGDLSSASYDVISPFLSFAHAIDFYGDGSLYIVDTPGHCPGHIAALARIAPNTFVFLGGDICHNRQCYNPGVRLISERVHRDLAVARDTVNRLIRFAEHAPNVMVILAHEAERLDEGMPLFPLEIGEWVVSYLADRTRV